MVPPYTPGLHDDLMGRRCRPLVERQQDYHYIVVAVWVNPTTGRLMCGMLSDGGGTNALSFIDMEFEPGALRGGARTP